MSPQSQTPPKPSTDFGREMAGEEMPADLSGVLRQRNRRIAAADRIRYHAMMVAIGFLGGLAVMAPPVLWIASTQIGSGSDAAGPALTTVRASAGDFTGNNGATPTLVSVPRLTARETERPIATQDNGRDARPAARAIEPDRVGELHPGGSKAEPDVLSVESAARPGLVTEDPGRGSPGAGSATPSGGGPAVAQATDAVVAGLPDPVPSTAPVVPGVTVDDATVSSPPIAEGGRGTRAEAPPARSPPARDHPEARSEALSEAAPPAASRPVAPSPVPAQPLPRNRDVDRPPTPAAPAVVTPADQPATSPSPSPSPPATPTPSQLGASEGATAVREAPVDPAATQAAVRDPIPPDPVPPVRIAPDPVPPEPVRADPAVPVLEAARAMFLDGDIAGVRRLLSSPDLAARGEAVFMLAETWDPNVLAALGITGLMAETAQARKLYEQARAMGMEAAEQRLEALR